MENERLARVEESAKQAHKRIDTLENKVENIYELTTSVKELAIETKAMREDFNKMDERVKSIEEKPAKNWDKVISLIITRNCNCNFGLFFSKSWIIRKRC